MTDYSADDWRWHARQASPGRVVDRQNLWGELAYRIWLPNMDAVVRARPEDLTGLSSVQPTVEQILHTTAAARLLDALEDTLPYPHMARCI